MSQIQEFIFDVTTLNFQSQVLDKSNQAPVIVDFWAPWCPPCRVLKPVLEKAVSALQGTVLLAKVNTDEEPELAQRYNVTNIPVVKAFHGGKLVSEFVGARDLTFVNDFLGKLTSTAPAQEVNLLEQAKMQIRKGNYVEAQGMLAQVNPRDAQIESVEKLKHLIEFYKNAEGYTASLSEDGSLSPRARYAKAATLASKGDYRHALDELLALLQQDRNFRNDGARQAILLLFDFLGPQHDLTQEYRRRLQVIL